MQIEVKSARLEHGTLILTLGDAYQLRKAGDLLKDGGLFDLTEHQEKRSNQANRYLWSLCNQIAVAVKSTKEDVYREAVKRVGIYRDFDPLPPQQAKTLRSAWEKLGTGWITEQVDYDTAGENVVIRCYYGSSTYNKKQMCRLLDDVIQDADELGIETYDKQRIDSLLEELNEK